MTVNLSEIMALPEPERALCLELWDNRNTIGSLLKRFPNEDTSPRKIDALLGDYLKAKGVSQ